jgi:hypothetical protein
MLTLIGLLLFAIGAGSARRVIVFNQGMMHNPGFEGLRISVLDT